MGKVYDAINDQLAGWLQRQPVFFVGTAPLDADGCINVSPKGMAGTFAVLDARRVAYLDYTGSGTETIAHLRENGRIVLMFCAFSGPPKIVRLHGTGHAVPTWDPRFAALRAHFAKERTTGQRCVVVVDVTRVSDSCGFSVPRLDHRGDRNRLDRAHERRDEHYFERYWRTKNAVSIDGLPGMPLPVTTRAEGE